MQQPSRSYNDVLQAVLTPIIKQLDRLEEHTRDLAKRSDLETVRKELVARDSLEPQLSALRSLIAQVDKDRAKDREEVEERMDKIEAEQINRQDRLWMRLGPAVGAAGFGLAFYGFLSHLKFMP